VHEVAALYSWYRENAAMQCRMLGERATVPELDAWMAQANDALLAAFAEHLSAGFERVHARTLVALALDFWTWQRLDAEGLGDAAAAALMADAVACAPAPARSRARTSANARRARR
jgi:hypothetical protein